MPPINAPIHTSSVAETVQLPLAKVSFQAPLVGQIYRSLKKITCLYPLDRWTGNYR